MWDSIVNIISILGISQGLFLALVLGRKGRANQRANKLLALLLVLCSIMMATRLVLMQYPSIVLFQRLSLIEPIIFLYGPVSLTYLKLLFQEHAKGSNEWRNYVPAISYLVFVVYLNTLSPVEFGEKLGSGAFSISFFLIELAALVQNLYYWYLSNRFIAGYNRKKRQQSSFDQVSTKFVLILHYLMGTILVIWALGFLANNVLGTNNFWLGYNAIWIALSSVIYFIGYLAMVQPEMFKIEELGFSVRDSDRGNEYKRLTERDVNALRSRLERLLERDKFYLDSELTLSALADKLDTTSNNLSWLLNNIYRKSFYDFVNELRVEEFIAKVENGEHIKSTLLALSMEVGFNSKSTFNKAFKAYKSETPTDFIKNNI